MEPAADLAFLGGRVAKRNLPRIEGGFGTQTPHLKRLLLPQGELAQFHDSDEGMRYIAFVELRTGAIRGNHYHKHKEEWVYLIDGEVRLVVEDLSSRARESVPLLAGDLVRIGVGIAHALQTVHPGQAIEFSSVRFDPDDTYRMVVTSPL